MIGKVYKEDYKNYRECAKKVYLLRQEYHHLTLEWQDFELTYFFNLPDNDSISNHETSDNIDSSNLKLFSSEDYSFSDLSSINSEMVLDGLEVGYHAKQYFLREYNCFDLDIYEKNLVASKTQEKLADETIDVLFEPRFEYDDCVMKADILKRNGDEWDLIEVKATSKVHKEHLYDVLYQYYILINCGIKIKNIYLMHLNGNYYHYGDLDYDVLFIISSMYSLTSTNSKKENILLGVKKELSIRDIVQDINHIKKILTTKTDDALLLMKNRICDNNSKKQYCCHVYPKLPNKHTIFNLYRLRREKKAEIYYEHNLLKLDDYNLLTLPLSENQLRQIKVVQNLEPIVKNDAKNYLQTIYRKYDFPIYMYDFETVKSAIPKYDYSYPYQQIPFQYSIHTLISDEWNNKKDKIIHHSYLADAQKDHRLELVQKLTADLTKYGIGTYVAYNKSFEKQVLKKLALLFPEYEEMLLTISERTVDLMDFFKNFAIYHPDFNGSLSIKKTLPAFNQEFSYDDLEVQKGTQASSLFRKRLYNQLEKDDKDLFFLKLSTSWITISLEQWEKKYANSLKYYCERDTYGMVILFNKMTELLKKQGWI